MALRRIALILLTLVAALPALALDWQRAGATWLVTNDFFGDRHDRWQTSSMQAGQFLSLPGGRVDLLELRLLSRVMVPWNLSRPAPGERPLAGVVSAGIHGYHRGADVTLRFGLDLVGTGPATRYDDVLSRMHSVRQSPSKQVEDDQVGNGLHPTLSAEASRRLNLGSLADLVPWFELRAGDETLARAGVDLLAGPGRGGFGPAREEATGFLMPMIGAHGRNPGGGWALVLGLDAARIVDSVYLPDDHAVEAEDTRLRARAGGLWNGQRMQLFYGVTWLGEEFEAQPEPQIVGAVHAAWRF